jgi:replicative DNA helicase
MTNTALTKSAPSILPTDKLRQVATAVEPVAFRQPPHNLEAEQALLGAILVNNESHDRVSAFLDPEHFFDPLHGQIYETGNARYRQNLL